MSNGMKSFKEYHNRNKLRLIVVTILLGILVIAPMVAAAEKPTSGIVPPDSKFQGKTYAEWSVKWWQWVLAIPIEDNPLYDDGTGVNTINAQKGDVWFLTGSYVGTEALTINVPEGKAIFFPIINEESSQIEGYGNNEAELRHDAETTMSCVTEKKASVDGKDIQNLDKYLVKSNLFSFKLPPDDVNGNPTNVLPPNPLPILAGPKGCKSIAVAHGYWIMLKPLSLGKHTIEIYGRAEFPNGSEFVTKMTYKLNIVPKNQKK